MLLAAGCVVWLAGAINWKNALAECLEASPLILALVFAQRYLPYMMLGLRLEKIFPGKTGFMDGFKASLLCVGCNNVLPARAGELVKIFWLRRKSGIEYSHLFSGVFLERLLDVSALLLLALCFASAFMPAWLAAGLGIVLAATWLAALRLGRLPELARKCLYFLPSAALRWMDEFLAFLGWQTKNGNFCKIAGATLLVWAMNYLHIYLLADTLMDLRLGFGALGLLCVAVFFSSGLMLLPGGMGGMEAAVVIVLGLLGIGEAKAAATAIFVRLFYSVPPILGACAVLAFGSTGFANGLMLIHGAAINQKKVETDNEAG